MIGITAAIGEFFAALGWTIVRTGAGVGVAAVIGAATGAGLIRARRKRKASRKP
ncbi:MAG: hypothetical protein V4659_04315 [Pseudomonadota bacterium]